MRRAPGAPGSGLPAVLPAQAVRRVVCDHCEETYEASDLVEVRQRRLRLPAKPSLGEQGQEPADFNADGFNAGRIRHCAGSP